MKTFVKFNAKKLKGSIFLTLSIFILAIMAFSICAIDAGYVVTSRYKTQKITETIALYMVSTLNSLPPDKRNENSLKEIKETFENLYSSNELSGYYSFKITDIQIRNADSSPKIKVSTETYTPPLFLRYAGIGLIRILQTSYAAAEETNMPYDSSLSTEKFFTFKAKNTITDKSGFDIKVDYDGGYFIFAGLSDSNGTIRWTDIGSLTSGAKTEFTLIDKITNNKIKAYCVTDSNTFDFNSNLDKSIGLVKYLRIYKMDCTKEELQAYEDEDETIIKEETPEEEEKSQEEEEDKTAFDDTSLENKTTEEDLDDTIEDNKPVVTILNSVKLIKKSRF